MLLFPKDFYLHCNIAGVRNGFRVMPCIMKLHKTRWNRMQRFHVIADFISVHHHYNKFEQSNLLFRYTHASKIGLPPAFPGAAVLPPALSSGSHDEQERILGGLMLKLLDTMFQARSAAIVAEQEIRQTRGTSWNLLLTKRAIHLIPRVMEDFPLGQGIDDEEVGDLSLNALCFAGHLVTKSNQEIEHIKKYPGGIRAILSQVGVKPVSDFTVASTGTEGPTGE